MVPKDEARLRIDPVLVDKFKRLPGGINEVGVKIVRDLGLRYEYNKKSHDLDIFGPDTEILGLAVETLRFWVEDDDYPYTGITCQVGYPNRCMVIWRFHGDYAKKFDHLFTEEIAKLKLVPTVNIKAVPSKRNPVYIELYCHFSVYHTIKNDISRISYELGKIYHDDFFMPRMDYEKARAFAKSKVNDEQVLFALKLHPEMDSVRVWIFARDQQEVIRARREWVEHVGHIAKDYEYEAETKRDVEIKSASFFGHVSSTASETCQEEKPRREPTKTKWPQTYRVKGGSFSKEIVSPRTASLWPKYDNSNFPRPPNFVYPVNAEVPSIDAELKPKESKDDPFAFNFQTAEELPETSHEKSNSTVNPVAGTASWVSGKEQELYRARRNTRPVPPNRIYVHHHISNSQSDTEPQQAEEETAAEKIVHPETNLVAKERFNMRTKPQVLTSVTDARLAPSVRRGSKNMRPGGKQKLHQGAVRQKPKMPLKRPEAPPMRFKINVNGLAIFMYKHNVAKLDGMDALINPVNVDIKSGGNIAKSVFDVAGRQVKDEISVHYNLYGDLNTSENTVTSAGKIPALGIIHVACPVWTDYEHLTIEECARDLHTAIYQSLKTAEKQKYRKVGLPVLGAEPCFGIPRELVAEVYVKALVDYSLGMGPLYPVLEIHLVDTDTQLLLNIKEAYEKWATDPAMIDLAQTLGSGVHDAAGLSELSLSAVNLREVPSHTSENMVTYLEQSYNEDGNQRWTFNILKKLNVHVYTGSIVKIEGVDAVVCAVDSNIKGSLAKHIMQAGGVAYEKSLNQASHKRILEEGDVVVSRAGSLGTDLVIHVVISQPVHRATQKNLGRLEDVNNQVLNIANRLGVRSLAMPLLGTGRLREKFEVEQCSLQLVDTIIELSLSLESDFTINELHLVNTNNVTTQSLTQALRTRGHTQLRLEAEPNRLARQNILANSAEGLRDSSNHVSLKATDARTDKFTTTSDTNLDDDKTTQQIKNKHGDPLIGVYDKNGNKKKPEEPKPKIVVNELTASKKENISIKTETKETKRKSDKNETDGKTVLPLSQKNLKVHEKLQSAWVEQKKSPEQKKSKAKLKRHNQLDPIEDLPHRPIHKDKSRIRTKPLNTQYVLQRSRAESYKEMFEKKRLRLTAETKEDKKHKRSKSTDGIPANIIADDVYQGFQTERRNLERVREAKIKEPRSHEKPMTKASDDNKLKNSEKHSENNVNTFNQGQDSKQNMSIKYVKSVSSPGKIATKEVKKDWVRGVGYDTEREDMYMKDMDFNARQKLDVENKNNESEADKNAQHDAFGSKEKEKINSDDIVEVQNNQNGAVENIISNEEIETEESQLKTPQEEVSENETNSVALPDTPKEANSEENGLGNSEEGRNAVHEKDVENGDKPGVSEHLLDSDMTEQVIEPKHEDENLSQNVVEDTNSQHLNDIPRKDENHLSYNKHDELKVRNRRKPYNFDSLLKKGKTTKNAQRRLSLPAANDVTIRDKIKLEIDVVDSKNLDTEKIKREKAKIRRFWEVVGDNEGKKIHIDDENEKVIVAKVTKERKMSARSRGSKKTDVSSITHNRGHFNVTLELKS